MTTDKPAQPEPFVMLPDEDGVFSGSYSECMKRVVMNAIDAAAANPEQVPRFDCYHYGSVCHEGEDAYADCEFGMEPGTEYVCSGDYDALAARAAAVEKERDALRKRLQEVLDAPHGNVSSKDPTGVNVTLDGYWLAAVRQELSDADSASQS